MPRGNAARRAAGLRVALMTLPWAGTLGACTTPIPGVMPREISRDAVIQERERCDRTPVDPRIYGAEVVQQVEPYYRHVVGWPNGREARFAGAELRLRPLPGVTAELLERGLTCRSARLMLGHAEPAPAEP